MYHVHFQTTNTLQQLLHTVTYCLGAGGTANRSSSRAARGMGLTARLPWDCTGSQRFPGNRRSNPSAVAASPAAPPAQRTDIDGQGLGPHYCPANHHNSTGTLLMRCSVKLLSIERLSGAGEIIICCPTQAINNQNISFARWLKAFVSENWFLLECVNCSTQNWSCYM